MRRELVGTRKELTVIWAVVEAVEVPVLDDDWEDEEDDEEEDVVVVVALVLVGVVIGLGVLVGG